MFLWCVRDGWRDIYSERGLLLPISSSRILGLPTLSLPCKLVRDASGRLRVPRLTAILSTLSKSDHMVLITWSLSGYTPVRPDCPDASSSSCLLIKMWQLTKAHEVTWNEPKIHVICYITIIRIAFSNWTQAALLPASYCLQSVAKVVSLLFSYFIKFRIFSSIQIWWMLDSVILETILLMIILMLVTTLVIISNSCLHWTKYLICLYYLFVFKVVKIVFFFLFISFQNLLK